MRYLVDAGIWLQPVLRQAGEAEARAFLLATDPVDLAITDFSWHSVGVVCASRGLYEDYARFVADVIDPCRVTVLSLEAHDTARLVDVMRLYRLDFDDAYQYVAAEKHDLTLVARDKHFARTPRGYRRPRDLMPTAGDQT